MGLREGSMIGISRGLFVIIRVVVCQFVLLCEVEGGGRWTGLDGRGSSLWIGAGVNLILIWELR